MVVQALNPRQRQADFYEFKDSLPGTREFQASHGYLVRPCLKKEGKEEERKGGGRLTDIQTGRKKGREGRREGGRGEGRFKEKG